jgi:hypothetical protein
MSQEILGRLQRVQQEAEELRDLMASLRGGAPPGADGHDATEQVRVSIGPDGLPVEVRVEPGWQGRLAPDAVGPAVLEAFTAAVANGMRAWSDTLDQTSWQARAAQLDARSEFPERTPPPADGPGRTPSPLAASSSGARDASEVAEDVLRAAEQLRRQPAIQPQAGVGSDPSGNVSITLSRSGLEACEVRAGWASRQDGGALTSALAEALRTARSELDAQASPPSPDAFDHLLGEALAALRRVTDSTRGDSG